MKTPDQFEAEYFPAAKINNNKRLPLLKPELPDSKAGTFSAHTHPVDGGVAVELPRPEHRGGEAGVVNRVGPALGLQTEGRPGAIGGPALAGVPSR